MLIAEFTINHNQRRQHRFFQHKRMQNNMNYLLLLTQIFCQNKTKKRYAWIRLDGSHTNSCVGNQQIFTIYDYGGNSILAEPLKSRQGKVIAKAFMKTYERLTKYGHEVKLFVLHYKCLMDLKNTILKTDSKYKLVPYPTNNVLT